MLEWYELLPIIWLGFVCILDMWIGFELRLFYCRALKDILLKHIPPPTGHVTTSCPICHELLPHSPNFHAFCPSGITSIGSMWFELKHMCYRYLQLAFFEVISIQFFIGFIKSEYTNPLPYIVPLQMSQIIHISQIKVSDFYLLVAILFWIIFYFVITILKHNPCILFVNKRYRLFFLACIFVFSLSF